MNARHTRALVGDDIQKTRILVGKAVVVLPSDGRGNQQVEQGDIRTPRQFTAFFQPFGVLVEHRIDDMDEGFIGGKEAVPSSQQIAFQPSFQCMLAEHLHDPSIGRQFTVIGVFGERFGEPGFLSPRTAPLTG